MRGHWTVRLWGAAGGALWAAIAWASGAQADDRSPIPGTLTASVDLTSDYMFRGISQTSGGPAIQGSIGYSYKLFYASVWASSIDFGDAGDTATTLEMDWSAGITPTLGPIKFDLGAIYYNYPDSPKNLHENNYEVYLGASHAFGPATVGGKVFYSPEFFGKTGKEFYYSLPVSVDVGHGVSLSGAYDRTSFNDNSQGGTDYNDWNFGASASRLGFGLDIRYVDNDLKAVSNDNKIVVTISKSL
jgi:uncharacterized protein (TIGR02001 family)